MFTVKRFFSSHMNRVGAVLLVSLIAAVAAYWVDHEIVKSTIADYTNQKLILAALVFAGAAVVLHIIVPDA